MNKLVALIACMFLVVVTNVFADDSTTPATGAAPEASAPAAKTKHHHCHDHRCHCKHHHCDKDK